MFWNWINKNKVSIDDVGTNCVVITSILEWLYGCQSCELNLNLLIKTNAFSLLRLIKFWNYMEYLNLNIFILI